jgi:GR25 family glycosyltransferase involved in LPS biosynthesis
MKNIVICGCVKDCEHFIDRVFENINIISLHCNIIKIIISFDISKDKSLVKLCKYKKKYDIEILVNKNPLNSNRVINITNARNAYMNYLKHITDDIDRFIVMDFDDVCSLKINESIIKYVFDDSNDDLFKNCGITFNNERYYDFWALSFDEYIYSVWHTNNPKKMMFEMKTLLQDKMKSCDHYFTVDSAFNGFGIYDYNVFKDLQYDWNINQNHFDSKKINSLRQRGYILKNCGIDCEHRSFHFQAKEKNGRIVILKDCLFPPYSGEHASFLYDLSLPCNIHVCHYTPLVERKQYFIQQSSKLQIHKHVLFLESDDRESMNSERLKVFDTNKLKLSEISLFMKHLNGMETILKSQYTYGILMEDDCIFKNNFLHYLQEYVMHLPLDFDVIYPGYFPFSKYYTQYTGNKSPIRDTTIKVNNYFYDMTNQIIFPWTGNNKGTDFYIISKKCCQFLLNEVEKIKNTNDKISQPIDHYIGTKLSINKAKVYWVQNDIVEHGSLTIFNNSMEGRVNCLA